MSLVETITQLIEHYGIDALIQYVTFFYLLKVATMLISVAQLMGEAVIQLYHEFKSERISKSQVFVRHIENHFKDSEYIEKYGFNEETEVVCKICDKTLDYIWMMERDL